MAFFEKNQKYVQMDKEKKLKSNQKLIDAMERMEEKSFEIIRPEE